MGIGQYTYAVNCSNCGKIIEVVNPRLDEDPIRIWTTDFGLTLSNNIQIIRTRCARCRKEVWVKMQYR